MVIYLFIFSFIAAYLFVFYLLPLFLWLVIIDLEIQTLGASEFFKVF